MDCQTLSLPSDREASIGNSLLHWPAGGPAIDHPPSILLENQVKKVALVVASFALAACSDVTPTAPSAVAAPSFSKSAAPGQNKLRCFSGPSDGTVYGGSCTLNGGVDATSAVLDNTDGDPDGSYSGVYIRNVDLTGKHLGDITQLSFHYDGTTPGGGAPRFSLPISGGVYAFIAAADCNNGSGLVDAINDETCTIYYGSSSYANWAAFVTANSSVTLTSALPFIIADVPGRWTISDVHLTR